MPDNLFAQSYSQARHLSASNMAYLSSSRDEELAEEVDEPPDYFSQLFSQSHHLTSLSDNEFHKHIIRNSAPTESLLTKALLTSPTIRPTTIDQTTPRGRPRLMSTSSNWSSVSEASTVDLISDGITSPSRANTPSPPAPPLMTVLPSILQRTKIASQEPQMKTAFTKRELQPVERKPCITFACMGKQASAAEPPRMQAPVQQAENVAPKRKVGLTFACDVVAKEKSRPASPTKTHTQPVAIAETDKYARDPRRLYDSEDPDESWTNQPIDHSKLLKVDDLLKKEREIRKLSEEVEREAKQENGEDDDDEDDDNEDENGVDVDDEDDDDNEDDEEENEDGDDGDDEDVDEDDYDGDELEGGLSGNETDDEEGFASDDESDDDLFFGPHPPYDFAKPVCCRTASDTSVDTFPKPAYRKQVRSPTPELPDSTDFVCGTLDEDRPLEEAFVSCIEERKNKAKRKPTPQDIDPSFPVSDPESDDEPPVSVRKAKAPFSRSPSSTERRGRHRSPSPRCGPSRRSTVCHSPAPIRRINPGPTSPASTRRIHSPPPPTRSKQNSRHPSPAPPRGRTAGPHLFPGRNIPRTRSLPRPSACVRRAAKNARCLAGASPPKTRPVQIKRGAADIFKGLEKRRERRKAKMARKDRDEGRRAGEGAEKMRELALDLCGKGKIRPVQWVISA